MPPLPLKPFWETTDKKTVRLYQGDVIAVLKRLPEKSVQCCITSPPYFSLRSYLDKDHVDKSLEIGSEATPEEFVTKMVEVFREVKRVLRDDGILILNLGDSYDNGNLLGMPWRVALALQADGWILRSDIPWVRRSAMPESVRGRPAKALEYVFMLTKKSSYYYDSEAVRIKQAQPWRSTGKSEGTGTKGLETKESGANDGFGLHNSSGVIVPNYNPAGRNFRNADLWFESIDTPHGLTSIDDEFIGLDVTSEAYEGSHYACFPTRLVRPFLLAGTSEKGCCAKCKTPWRRVTKKVQLKRDRPNEYTKRTGEEGTGNSCANDVAGVDVTTVGWRPWCECFGKFVKRTEKRTCTIIDSTSEEKKQAKIEMGLHSNKSGSPRLESCETHEEEKEVTVTEYQSDLPLDDHPVVPCVILDPFVGSGTSCCVAIAHGRHSIGIDLSEDYLRNNAVPRIEGKLLSNPTTVDLVPRVVEKLTLGKVVSKKSENSANVTK